MTLYVCVSLDFSVYGCLCKCVSACKSMYLCGSVCLCLCSVFVCVSL